MVGLCGRFVLKSSFFPLGHSSHRTNRLLAVGVVTDYLISVGAARARNSARPLIVRMRAGREDTCVWELRTGRCLNTLQISATCACFLSRPTADHASREAVVLLGMASGGLVFLSVPPGDDVPRFRATLENSLMETRGQHGTILGAAARGHAAAVRADGGRPGGWVGAVDIRLVHMQPTRSGDGQEAIIAIARPTQIAVARVRLRRGGFELAILCEGDLGDYATKSLMVTEEEVRLRPPHRSLRLRRVHSGQQVHDRRSGPRHHTAGCRGADGGAAPHRRNAGESDAGGRLG
jgi:hypothetical protein